MKTEYPKQESVREEVTTVRKSFWASGQPASEFLTNAVKVATVLAACWGIAYSVVSGLENRLIDRMDISHRELSAQIEGVDRKLSAQIEGVDRERGAQIEGLERQQGALLAGQGTLRELSAQIEGLERSMAEGFNQAQQRMDRMDGRMDRMEGRMDRIESDIDAIEKHLYRLGAVEGREEAPAVVAPAVAKPHRSVSSMDAVQSSHESAAAPSDERKPQVWPDAASHLNGQDSPDDLGGSVDTPPVDRRDHRSPLGPLETRLVC